MFSGERGDAEIADIKDFFYSPETCNISNKTVDISSENSCDIRFKSQIRGVNLSLWIRSFYCSKAAFSGPTV